MSESAAPRRLPFAAIAIGAVAGVAALPPRWFPGAEWLVLLSLGVQFALATGARRPVLANYWLGALQIGAFSWSLRHVTWFGWLAVALLGGLYHALAASATQRARWPALAFAVATAGACWLRAEMPGIAYPHGQPAHVLGGAPSWLGAVVLGGEPLQNALLAGLGAAAVRLWRAWRTAIPSAGAALRTFAVALLAQLAVALAFAPRAESNATVAIAAIEPGIHPIDAMDGVAPGDFDAVDRHWRNLVEERLLRPTEAIAGSASEQPPTLVLWPESSLWIAAEERADGSVRFDALRSAVRLAPGSRLLFGGSILRGGRQTPAAILVDAAGGYVAHHEKQRLVPGGETLPGMSLLPDALARRVAAFLQTAVGLPDLVAGAARAPLEVPTPNGPVRFAGLVCYDNAFPSTVGGAVADGAQFVAVLSNESWYRGGAEREQLAAITVLRAVATATPIVRCTTDGLTMAVDGNGRVLAGLPPAPAMQPAARILRVDLPVGPGRLPPMARVHPWLGWLAAAWLLLPLLHGLCTWVTLLRPVRPTPAVADARRADDPRGGS